MMIEQKQSDVVKETNPLLYLIYNIVGLGSVIVSHHIDPTSLAGPGLDLMFGIGYWLFALLLIFITISRLIKASRLKVTKTKIVLSIMINLAGLIAVFILANLG
ncbi:MAG: hypothetical protein ACTHJ8_06060 [Mucilaginibacter sp.]